MVSFNLTESHFDNDLIIETNFKTLIDNYTTYNGPGVYGKTFRFYVKNQYDPVPSEIRRILPVTKRMTVKTQEIIEDDEDLVESYRYIHIPIMMSCFVYYEILFRIFGLPVGIALMICSLLFCIRSCYCKSWC